MWAHFEYEVDVEKLSVDLKRFPHRTSKRFIDSYSSRVLASYHAGAQGNGRRNGVYIYIYV